MSENNIQNPLLIQTTWNELVNYLRIYPGAPGDIAVLAKEPLAKKHIDALLEREVYKQKDGTVYPNSEAIFKEEVNRVKSFGIELPESFISLV